MSTRSTIKVVFRWPRNDHWSSVDVPASSPQQALALVRTRMRGHARRFAIYDPSIHSLLPSRWTQHERSMIEFLMMPVPDDQIL
jgi:hypothetical protein